MKRFVCAATAVCGWLLDGTAAAADGDVLSGCVSEVQACVQGDLTCVL